MPGILDWRDLPPEEFEQKLRDVQWSREDYDRRVAAIEADRRIEEELEAAGKLPTKLPEGKFSDPDSFGGID
jgi:hypothetical protein